MQAGQDGSVAGKVTLHGQCELFLKGCVRL